jgi:tetratricopeptide (TPR) repeat protein
VRPRSAVSHYKSSDVDLQKAAAELNVRGLVVGRVISHGEALDVAVELTDIRSNRNLWSEHYSRKLADALTVEQEIATEVSARLREHLTTAQKSLVHKGETSNPEAYQLYIKGRYHWDKRTPESLEKSKQLLEQAIALDPNYGLAYLGLAEYYDVLPDYVPVPTRDANPNVKLFVRKALEIDDAQPVAHAVLADSLSSDWEWAAATAEYQRALALDPNSARTHVLFGLFLRYLGKLDEARAQFLKAMELEPLNLNAAHNVALIDREKRDYEKSIEEAKKVLETDANYAIAHQDLSLAFLMLGRYQDWLLEWETHAKITNDSNELAELEAAKQGFARAGIRGAMVAKIRVEEEHSKRSYVDPATIAADYAYLGDRDHAFALLEEAAVEKSNALLRI